MNEYLFKLCLAKAQIILRQVKQQYPNSSKVFCKDPKPDHAEAIGQHATGFLNQSLPDILKAINDAVPGLARTQLATEKEISPQYNDLLSGLYEKYGPKVAKTGAQIDADILRGPGADVGRTAEGLNKEFNPEYYATRSKASGKLGELLGSVNLNDANPEAERLVSQENARTGNFATPSATGTVSNALSFGNELQKRRNALGSALNVASGFLPQSQSGAGLGAALGTTAKSNPATNQFAGVQGGAAATQGQGIVSGTFGQGVGAETNAANLTAQRRDVLDRVQEGVSAY